MKCNFHTIGYKENYLESCREANIPQQIKNIIKFYQSQIDPIKDEIQKHIDLNPNLKSKSKLLESIPGVGKITSAIILSECIPSLTPKQQVAHAGLTPRHNQSGKFNGKT